MNPAIITSPLGDRPPTATLYYGQTVLQTLRDLPADSVNMVATSPPYWSLRDYGVEAQVWGGDEDCDHQWGDERLSRGQAAPSFKNSTLGTKSGGNSISDAARQRSIENSIVAPRASSFCSSCGAWRGCLGLEPTPQLYVEHMVQIFREVRRVLHPSGTLWLNLGDTFFSSVGAGGEKVEGLKEKDLVGVPWRVALALQEDGWWLRNSIVWHKLNAMPSSIQDRFSCKYELVFLLTKSKRYFFDLEAVKVPHTFGTYSDTGEFEPGQHWAESGKGSRKMDTVTKHDGPRASPMPKAGRGFFGEKGKNPGDLWSLATSGYRGAHFAVWPPDLVQRMIKAGSSEKGRCPTCKAPWKRLVEVDEDGGIRRTGEENLTGDRKGQDAQDYDRLKLKGAGGVTAAKRVTVGWKPDCACPEHEPERCVVMDTFSGSGTTGMVAMQLGRDYLGIDLNPEYLKLARDRLEGRPSSGPAEGDEPNLIEDLFG